MNSVKNIILARMKEYSILNGIDDLTPITRGASGAYIFSGKDEKREYIIKYMPLLSIDVSIKRQFKKEYYFYEIASKLNIDFIPEVIFQTINSSEILIVFIKYTDIQNDDWNEALLLSAASTYAKINALDVHHFDKLFPKDAESTEECYPLSVSYDNWMKLADKFPDNIDSSILSDIYGKYAYIESIVENLQIPQTICHGDFHPNNCLINENKLLICDWQNIGVGRGVGDISFFISRGSDMGITIDSEKFIKRYCASLKEFANIEIDINDVYKEISASNLSCSFRFWAEYLQTSELSRVLGIYDSMVKDYYFLFH